MHLTHAAFLCIQSLISVYLTTSSNICHIINLLNWAFKVQLYLRQCFAIYTMLLGNNVTSSWKPYWMNTKKYKVIASVFSVKISNLL